MAIIPRARLRLHCASSARRNCCERTQPHGHTDPRRKRAGAWLANRFAIIAAVLVLFYLFLPVLYVFIFPSTTTAKSNIVEPQRQPDPQALDGPCGAPGVW